MVVGPFPQKYAHFSLQSHRAGRLARHGHSREVFALTPARRVGHRSQSPGGTVGKEPAPSTGGSLMRLGLFLWALGVWLTLGLGYVGGWCLAIRDVHRLQ